MSTSKVPTDKQKLMQAIFGTSDEELSDIEDQNIPDSSEEEVSPILLAPPIKSKPDISDKSMSKGPRPGKRKESLVSVTERRASTGSFKEKRKKKPKVKVQEAQAVDDQVHPSIAEVRRDFDLALAAATPSRRKLRTLDDEVELDKRISAFCDRMRDAAEEDIQLHTKHEPSLNKLNMLQSAITQLNRRDLHELLIDNGILDAIRSWLEPYPDGTLPSIDLRHALLEALQHIHIGSESLKESGLGKIVMFLYKHPHETRENKRLASKLIEKWSRPIMDQSMNYRDLPRMSNIQQRNTSDDDEMEHKRKYYSPAIMQANKEKYKKLLGHMERLSQKSTRK